MARNLATPRWWSYWNVGLGLFLLVAVVALFFGFDPTTVSAYVTLGLMTVAAGGFLAAGLVARFGGGRHGIGSRELTTVGQVFLGISMLWSPSVAVLDGSFGAYHILVVITGLFLIVLGIGRLYRPELFGLHVADEHDTA